MVWNGFALAVLADDNVVHGPPEVLLTMTEAGMMARSASSPAGCMRHPDQHRPEEEGEIYMAAQAASDFYL